MKKTYISPAALTVQLGTVQMMAESLRVNSNPSDPVIDNPNDILTKETNDINIWDNEW